VQCARREQQRVAHVIHAARSGRSNSIHVLRGKRRGTPVALAVSHSRSSTRGATIENSP